MIQYEIRFTLSKLSNKIVFFSHISEEGVFYIGGSDTLPPPLKKDEEEELMMRLDEGDEGVKTVLIERNLRLVVYIAE